MIQYETPALKRFLSTVQPECTMAQVVICRKETTFEIRHVDDRNKPADQLREVSEMELRAVSQFTAAGLFRPLKSAPDLQNGWRYSTQSLAHLDLALNTLYPNAIADWFAVRVDGPPVTQYRVFTQRQTGMYRITAMITDEQARPMIRACCHPKFCLKQRLWTVEGFAPDTVAAKSLIPCLEPCAILLEFARKAMRLEQERARGEQVDEAATEIESTEIRAADFESPANPRRVQLRIEQKMQASGKET